MSNELLPSDYLIYSIITFIFPTLLRLLPTLTYYFLLILPFFVSCRVIGETLSKVKNSWDSWQSAAQVYENAKEQREEQKQKSEDLELFLNEIDAAELNDPEEESKLQKEQDRLVNGVRLQEELSSLLQILREGNDHFPSVVDNFGVCINYLKSMSQLDNTIISAFENALALQFSLNDLISDLYQYSFCHLLILNFM